MEPPEFPESEMSLAAGRAAGIPSYARPQERATHTAGPWVAIHHEVRSHMGRIVARADTGLTNAEFDEAQANARLIASAPQMLDALRLAQRAILGQRTTGEAMVAISAALDAAGATETTATHADRKGGTETSSAAAAVDVGGAP